MAIFMENLKDKGFPRHAKESQKTYWCLQKVLGGRYESIVYEY
jgi:hypothetical protein